MRIIVKFIICIVLLFSCLTLAYSQNCESLLQRATDLVYQKKYCDARKYYQQYSKCNADADVSTEIVMCEKYCKIQGSIGDGDGDGVDIQIYTPNPKVSKSSVSSPSSTQSFNGFQLHAGLFLPQGDFGSDSKKDILEGKGHAATGFNLGFKVYTPISSVDGLSWFWGVDAFYNGLQKDYTEDEVEYYENNDMNYTLPFYLNFPITGGANYAYPINNKFSIYGEVAAGWNISKYIGGTESDSEGDYSTKNNWDIATNFAYGLEAGVLLLGKYTIGIRYYDLGSYKYKGKSIVEVDGEKEDEKIKFDKKLPISGISFTFGIMF